MFVCLCASNIYRTRYIILIKQYYQVRFRSTCARSHMNPLMWNRLFKKARDDSIESFILLNKQRKLYCRHLTISLVMFGHFLMFFFC